MFLFDSFCVFIEKILFNFLNEYLVWQVTATLWKLSFFTKRLEDSKDERLKKSIYSMWVWCQDKTNVCSDQKKAAKTYIKYFCCFPCVAFCVCVFCCFSRIWILLCLVRRDSSYCFHDNLCFHLFFLSQGDWPSPECFAWILEILATTKKAESRQLWRTALESTGIVYWSLFFCLYSRLESKLRVTVRVKFFLPKNSTECA